MHSFLLEFWFAQCGEHRSEFIDLHRATPVHVVHHEQGEEHFEQNDLVQILVKV